MADQTTGRSLYDEPGEGFTLLRRRGDDAGGEIEKAARIRPVPMKIVEGDEPSLALVRPGRYWPGPGTGSRPTRWH